MDENSTIARSRREGRLRACEGLLAARFGGRTSRAGARALDVLRSGLPAHESLPFATLNQEHPVKILLEPHRVKVPGPSGRGEWMALAASMVLVIAATFYVLSGRSYPPWAVVESHQASVIVERHGQVLTAYDGLCLQAGDVVRTGGEARAILRFERGATRLELGETTTLGLQSGPTGDQVDLNQGGLRIVAKRQAPDRPFRVTTPHATATFQFAESVLAVRSSLTWLEVMAGEAELCSPEKGALVRIHPREYGVAAPGLELAVQPVHVRWQTAYHVIKSIPRKATS